MSDIGNSAVLRKLGAAKNGFEGGRALVAALSAMGEEAERNTKDAAKTAANDVEQRLTALLVRTDKARAASESATREAIRDGLQQVQDAVKARDLKGADALVEKLSAVLATAREQAASTRDDFAASLRAVIGQMETSHESLRTELQSLATSIGEMKPVSTTRKPWNVTVSSRDDTGRAKTLKVTPE
jgi:hypothetical protein